MLLPLCDKSCRCLWLSGTEHSTGNCIYFSQVGCANLFIYLIDKELYTPRHGLIYLVEARDTESPHWYVLSAKDSIESLEMQFKAVSSLRQRRGMLPVEYFLPTCVHHTSLFGVPAIRRKKLMGNYVFIRESYSNVLEIKESMGALWLLPHPDRDPAGHRYMTISDAEMSNFMIAARAYANELPCYPIDRVDLDEGDKVEIVGGEFDGMCGTLQCSQGRKSGKVLVAVGNLFLIATPDLGPQHIRILQFGKGNRHPYRIFESHLPRAIQALHHCRGKGLTTDDIAALTVFVGRFEKLQPPTVNIASQHATLMLMSFVALEDRDNAELWLSRCRQILSRVKSDTQRAWQLAFMFAATGDDDLQCQARAIVGTWSISPHDRKRSLIVSALEEFAHVFDFAH